MFISSFYTNHKYILTVNLLALHNDTNVLSLSSVSFFFGGGEDEEWGSLTDIIFWVCVFLDLVLTTMQRKY